MAAKIQIQGYFHEVGEPIEVGEKKTKVQKVIFMQFGYQDRGRGIEEPDEPWVMELVGKTVDEQKLSIAHVGRTARITIWIKGFVVEATDKNKAFSGFRCNLTKCELIKTRA